MTSTIPAADEQEAKEKGVWVEPSVDRLDVGEAEGADGSGPESGQFLS